MIDNSKQKATRGTSGILSEADAGTAFSSVIDTVLGKIWQVVENEEYVERLLPMLTEYSCGALRATAP